MMGGYTKGPWGEIETESTVDLEYPDGGRISGWQDIGTPDGHVVAIVPSKDAETYQDGDAVAEANARLIAAAPDLYEACCPSDLEDAADIVEAENAFLASELRKQATKQRAALSKAGEQS